MSFFELATDRLMGRAAGLVFLDRLGAFDGLADVVALGPVCVLRAGRPSWARLGRFWCGRRTGCRRADVAKPPGGRGRG